MAFSQSEQANSEGSSWGMNKVDFGQMATDYGLPLLKAIAVLVVGLWIIGILAKVAKRYMEKSALDKSLRTFLVSIVSNLLKVLLLISVLGMLGIEMTSFIALLAAAGLAVGMA